MLKKSFVVDDERGDVVFGKSAVQSAAHEVGVHGGPGEHANVPLIPIRIVPRILERLVGQLRQNAMLGIHGSGFHRREAEEPCVKVSRLVKDRRGFYIVRLLEISTRHTRPEHVVVR